MVFVTKRAANATYEPIGIDSHAPHGPLFKMHPDTRDGSISSSTFTISTSDDSIGSYQDDLQVDHYVHEDQAPQMANDRDV